MNATQTIRTENDAFGNTIVTIAGNAKAQVRIDHELTATAGHYEAYVDTFFPTRHGCAIQYKTMKAALRAAAKWLRTAAA